jgi:hypothetical protein
MLQKPVQHPQDADRVQCFRWRITNATKTCVAASGLKEGPLRDFRSCPTASASRQSWPASALSLAGVLPQEYSAATGVFQGVPQMVAYRSIERSAKWLRRIRGEALRDLSHSFRLEPYEHL